ncbi:MAG: hypothetical protein LAO20_04455 [Acidobacteriia bacterium]|nr:hypothetical protein [Terriglobia bacterium]
MHTYLRKKRIVVLFSINILILLLLPPPSQCQNTCLGPATEGFGTREAWVAVDISRLTPNTAVDPDPTVRPKEIGCHPESSKIGDRTTTLIVDCRSMTTRDQHLAGKITPDDFYSSRAGLHCRNDLRPGVSFYRLPYLIFGRDEADSQGTLRFRRYGIRETWVWYKADISSFYLLASYMNSYDLLLGPFKGDPLVELRKAIRPHRERTLPGVAASAVSHYFYDARKRPPETPPPSPVPPTTNLTPDMIWEREWSLWNSSNTTVRLTNNTGRVLYYLSNEGALVVEETKTEGGIYAYALGGTWRKLEPGQSVEGQIFNMGANLSLSECARGREAAQRFATKKVRTAGSSVEPATSDFPCQMTALKRHVVAFVNTEPVFHDEIPIEITYTPPLRETLPPDAPAVVPAQ